MALWSYVLFKNILIGLTLDYQLGIYANLTRNNGDRKCKAFFRLRFGLTSAFRKNVYTTSILVIWRWWKISLRTECRGAPPGEMKHLHQDFLNDSVLQEQIAVVFGSRILEYALALCRGHFDYLERLPDKLLLKILSYISLQDIGRMSQTSSRFRKLCNSDEIWKQAVLGHCDINPEEIESLAKVMGWKNIFFEFCFKKEHDSTACPAEEEDKDNTESP